METAVNQTQLNEIAEQVEAVAEQEAKVYGLPLSPGPAAGLGSKVILDHLQANEDGDARLFIHMRKEGFCYDHSTGKWHRWVGHYWQEDIVGEVYTEIDCIVEKYSEEASRQAWARQAAAKSKNKGAEQKAEALEKDLIKRIFDLQAVYRKKNVLFLAAHGSGSLGITGEEWDKDAWVLGCKNGVLDLKTGQLRPGVPSEYIKTIAPTDWKGIDEPSPAWEQFLTEIFEGDKELIGYIQRLYGYSIMGLAVEHILPILCGEGRNGKGTLLETLAYVLGPIAAPIQAEMLLSEGRLRSSAGPSADIMSLRGRRIVWGSETDDGRKLDLGKVKLLTGSDTLTGRPPHGRRMIEFRPSHTLFLLTNHKPLVPANEYAMWERIHLIPFRLSYVDEPERLNERKRDPYLPDRLKAEASGILAWLVRGCLEWQQNGLNPPNIVKEATAQYQEDEDILGHFLSECTSSGPGARARAQDLYNAYKKWCDENGHKSLGGRTFGERMGERFTRKNEASGRYYQGMALLTFEPACGDAKMADYV